MNHGINNFFKSETFHYLLVILLAYFSGCARGPVVEVVQPGGPVLPSFVISEPPLTFPKNLYHEVGPSETLWRIGKSYGVDTDAILKANRISDPAQIKNGQRLLIPNSRGPRSVVALYPTKRWTHIVIHHTATELGNARTIDRMHHNRGFWNGLGYHFLIDNGSEGKIDGQIESGPRWVKQEVGAHANAGGMNEHGIGISLVGNFSEGRPSPKQMESLLFLVKTLKTYYRIPNENIIAHRDVPGKNTECPGTQFPWGDLKKRLG